MLAHPTLFPSLAAAGACVAASLLLGCPKATDETRELPPGDQPPAIAVLEFAQTEDAFAPQVRDATNFESVPWEALPAALTDERETEMVSALLADPEVAAVLGERFAYVSLERLEGDKSESEEELPARYRADFFSHSNNVTVRVEVGERERGDVERIEPSAYQPPASPAELDQAIAMAAEALRAADYPFQELEAAGILAFPSDGEIGKAAFHGSRVLYVSFSEGGFAPPIYYALVDLTLDEVVEFGPAAGATQAKEDASDD